MEKTLLVTSTWDSFPIPTEDEDPTTPTLNSVSLSGSNPSAPPTPIFSPIPFLHGDARAQSRSPPPLSLNEVKQEPLALGLVDEMDDPRPGHMSDYPTAISSTTSTSPASLENRFVRAGSSGEEERGTKRQKTEDGDTMMEENDDKKNQG